MAMGVPEIRGWLLTQPRPSVLKVITTDDRHHEVAVSNGVSWMAIAQSIAALDPALIEAYDLDGKVLRAVRPIEQGHATGTGASPAPLALPANCDPQSAMLIHFADLLAGAYRHSTEIAFERMVSMFEAVNRRSEALEASLDATHKLLRRAYQETLENAEAPPAKGGNLLEDMVGGFLSSAAQQQSAAAAHGPNGKAG
jgi:hypothetical protein